MWEVLFYIFYVLLCYTPHCADFYGFVKAQVSGDCLGISTTSILIFALLEKYQINMIIANAQNRNSIKPRQRIERELNAETVLDNKTFPSPISR